MKQTKKGQQWYFGMKVHVETDTRGLVHSLTTTDAAMVDISQLSDQLHGQESTLYGDEAYYKAEDKVYWEACGGTYRVNRRGKCTTQWEKINATRSKIRARCDHVFHVIKNLWEFTKVRHRGLAKNTVRAFAAFALANLYQVRHKLRPQGT